MRMTKRIDWLIYVWHVQIGNFEMKSGVFEYQQVIIEDCKGTLFPFMCFKIV